MQEEILEEIRLLKVREQRDGSSEALDIRIASENNKLTALINSQQGKFHHLFPLPFPNLLDVILRPNLFRHLLLTHPGSANTQGKR